VKNYKALSRALRALACTIFGAVILCPVSSAQQDINIIGGTSPYIILGRGLQWAGSGFGNLNNNFIFTPTGPDVGFCLFMQNNNSSSAHSITVAVSQTGDPALKNFQGVTGKWNTVPTSSTFPFNVPAGSVVGINYKTSASANIAVTFSGGTLQAGSPDTVDIFAVQTTQSSCGALASNSVQGVYTNGANVTNAQNFPVLIGGYASPGVTGSALGMHIGTTGQGLLLDGGVCCQSWASGFVTPSNFSSATFSKLAGSFGTQQQGEQVIDVLPMASVGGKGWTVGFQRTSFLEAATDQNYLTQSNQPAWVVLGKLTNPTAGANLLTHFNTLADPNNPAYKHLVLSCSAACELSVSRITARGTTCTTLTPQNLQLGNGGTVLNPNAGDITENGCTGAPTFGNNMYDINLAAGGTFQIDLSGFVNFHNAGAGGGFAVSVVAGITGVATASLTWMEQ